MAVISTRKDNKLTLEIDNVEIDNGDYTKMEEVLKRWNFKTK